VDHITGFIAMGSIALLCHGARLDAQTVTGASFVVLQYKTGSTVSLYAARRVGAGMAVGGLVGRPGSNSRTAVAGLGTRIRFSPGAAAIVILAGATGSDGESLRLYVLPKVTAGRIALTGTTAVYQPLGGAGARLASLDPLTLSVRVVGRVRAGIAGVATARSGRGLTFGAGPSLRVPASGGTFALELVSRQSGPMMIRVGFSAWAR
jgi:hypothetical protein